MITFWKICKFLSSLKCGSQFQFLAFLMLCIKPAAVGAHFKSYMGVGLNPALHSQLLLCGGWGPCCHLFRLLQCSRKHNSVGKHADQGSNSNSGVLLTSCASGAICEPLWCLCFLLWDMGLVQLDRCCAWYMANARLSVGVFSISNLASLLLA